MISNRQHHTGAGSCRCSGDCAGCQRPVSRDPFNGEAGGQSPPHRESSGIAGGRAQAPGGWLAQRPWLWFYAAFVVLIGSWTAMITLAVKHRPRTVEITKGQWPMEEPAAVRTSREPAQ